MVFSSYRKEAVVYILLFLYEKSEFLMFSRAVRSHRPSTHPGVPETVKYIILYTHHRQCTGLNDFSTAKYCVLTNKIDVYYVLRMQYFCSSPERATRNATPRKKYPSLKLYIPYIIVLWNFHWDIPLLKKNTIYLLRICTRAWKRLLAPKCFVNTEKSYIFMQSNAILLNTILIKHKIWIYVCEYTRVLTIRLEFTDRFNWNLYLCHHTYVLYCEQYIQIFFLFV